MGLQTKLLSPITGPLSFTIFSPKKKKLDFFQWKIHSSSFLISIGSRAPCNSSGHGRRRAWVSRLSKLSSLVSKLFCNYGNHGTFLFHSCFPETWFSLRIQGLGDHQPWIKEIIDEGAESPVFWLWSDRMWTPGEYYGRCVLSLAFISLFSFFFVEFFLE